MTPEAIVEALKMRDVHVEVVGDKLRCRAAVGVLTPELRQALAEHKAALLRLLTVPASDDHHDRLEPRCAICGASDWRETPDGGRWCLPCVLNGRERVAAVKVQSPVLDADVWVVSDDLPREQWPTDAPVYTHAEVKILTQVGPDTLAWVHATKELFHVRVVRGGHRPSPASDSKQAQEEGIHG